MSRGIEVASYKGDRRPLWLKVLLALLAAGVMMTAVVMKKVNG